MNDYRVRTGRFRRLAPAVAAILSVAAGILALTGTAHAAAGTDRLNPGESLAPNQRLVSPDGQYALVMQGDGNLVVYAPGGRPIWATGTGRAGSNVEMQGDGNLVVYAYPGHVPVWASGTGGIPNLHLELQNDGNQVLYTAGHEARWSAQRITDRNNQLQVKYNAYVSMRGNGWADSQWGCLDSLWNRESGWRWNALNGANPDTGAYGIPQARPGNKMGQFGADWRTNPETQTRWGLSYIESRHGSPCRAWDYFRARGSY